MWRGIKEERRGYEKKDMVVREFLGNTLVSQWKQKDHEWERMGELTRAREREKKDDMGGAQV